MQSFGLPSALYDQAERALARLGFSWQRPTELARAVRQLSDFYIAQPTAATPWQERWAQAAYLAYFLPLNFARVSRVVDEGLNRGFFSGLKSLIDFGSGPGTAQLAVSRRVPEIELSICVDRRREPLDLHQLLAGDAHPGLRLRTDLPSTVLPERNTRLAIFSYAWTELERLPAWALESEALLIVEPSTREDGRRLLEMRRTCLAHGFHVWAPCTHAGPCPLLEKGERDWCHDRIAWSPTPEWTALEQELPMKNRTLTFSYLLLRKTPPPEATSTRLARMIGDPLAEKGKTRQLVCRGPDREFLAWFPQRLQELPQLDRGDLIELGSDLQIKANELRIRDPQKEIRRVPRS